MSTVFKVSELVGTRFLYVTIGIDLKYVLHCCERLKADSSAMLNAGNDVQEKLHNAVRAGEEPIFDLCECNITSDISQIIFEWQDKGWSFTDSKDDYRRFILEENERRKREKPDEIVPMPEFKLNGSIVDYIKYLRTDVVYIYPSATDLYFALVIMTALLRPTVKFEMDNVMAKVLDIISSSLPISLLNEYTEFYYHTTEGVEILTANDGKVMTQRLGEVTIEKASYGGYLVPTAFGREVLYKTPGWNIVFKNALDFVNRSKELRAKTLREVLVGD